MAFHTAESPLIRSTLLHQGRGVCHPLMKAKCANRRCNELYYQFHYNFDHDIKDRFNLKNEIEWFGCFLARDPTLEGT